MWAIFRNLINTSPRTKEILLSGIIPKSYHELHRLVKSGEYLHYWLQGGRGSGKSSFVSLEIILLIMAQRDLNAVAIRKIGQYLKDSVFQQLLWAINILGVDGLWQAHLSPLELTYLPTGQKILFRGSDKPEKLKSTKVAKGYIGLVWFEELAEFASIDEVRNINQSLLRGGQRSRVFYTYNPPKTVSSWVNQVASKRGQENTCYHHSTYLDLPQQWLGAAFLQEAAYLKESNPKVYHHEYLGEVVGSGAEVFNNLELRPITPAEIQSFDYICQGVDWGYGKDPFVYVALAYNRKCQEIAIFREFFKTGAKFDEIADFIKKSQISEGPVIADSAEPRSNDELKDRGIWVVAAKKGAGSIGHGISWLQNLKKIIIDSERCPNVAREFQGYEFVPDGYGGYRGGYADRDNHTIDAVRYSLERVIRKKTISFT